jgi:hypothetical protein
VTTQLLLALGIPISYLLISTLRLLSRLKHNGRTFYWR